MASAEPLLRIRDLAASFRTERGYVRVVDGVSFDVPAGRTVGLVGESGCGKSMTSLSILRLLPPGGRIESGEILLRDVNLLELPETAMRSYRGRKIAMVFQEPMTSLNPVYTVGSQIVEILRLHHTLDRSRARARAIEVLELVGIGSPHTRVDAYPHQLSGGMRQRVMIAMALACEPDLLIADEPTTALDVTVQAQILDLLRRLSLDFHMSVLLITHDLGVVAEFVEEVVVMYAGQLVERAPVQALFRKPLHPYTQGLLASIPPMGAPARSPMGPPARSTDADGASKRRLRSIPGNPPDLARLPAGCRFADRCSYVRDACRSAVPKLESLGDGRFSRCLFAADLARAPEPKDG